MNVLVTGGAGYIGSHTCKLLKKNGHTPVVLDNLSTGNEWAVKWGPFYKGDIQDKDLVIDIVNKESIEAVIHFAANAYVGESMQKPLMYFRNNIANTTEFVEALKHTSVRKIVFSSTCATYGVPESLPIIEATPQKPVNPYGFTKFAIEQLLAAMYNAEGFSSVSLRYFNAAGADPDNEIGEWHNPETHLIPLVLKAAINDGTIKVFGDDYATEDGSCVRDYIHVLDLADAHLKALELLTKQPGTYACNLGTGHGASVFDIIKNVEKVLDKELNYQVENRRPGDPPALVASAEYANELLGWTARYDLGDIINHATRWLEKAEQEL